MLTNIDKFSVIEPSMEAAKSEWAKFQVEVYEETVRILGKKNTVLFAPSLVLRRGVRTVRTGLTA